MIKQIALIFILLTSTLIAKNTETDLRLNHYPRALKWLQDSDTNGESAYNIGVLYHKEIKDNDKAIQWYKKAYGMEDKGASINSSINLGNIYKKLHQYDDAIFYYKKAYRLGDIGAANALGYLYSTELKKKEKAIQWYQQAAKHGYADAIENLSYVYHDKKDNIMATAYVLATINYGFNKDDTLKYLKKEWKIDRKTLKQAYKLQQTLDIPKHYTGGID